MRVEVRGVAQDGGVPHVGCRCAACEAARADPALVRYPSALLVESGPERYLVDAPPDLRHRVVGDALDGVLLTHAHLGHLAGVLQFGPEAADADALAVHCTAGVADLLRENQPFRGLVDGGNLAPTEFGDGSDLALPDGRIEAHAVDHRDELGTGTLSVRVVGEERSLYYASDVDAWTGPTEGLVREADVALVDGTFWSRDELDRADEVPHPAMTATMDRFDGVETDVWFTHLNHTNPALEEDSPEREEVEGRGFGVVERGRVFEL